MMVTRPKPRSAAVAMELNAQLVPSASRAHLLELHNDSAGILKFWAQPAWRSTSRRRHTSAEVVGGLLATGYGLRPAAAGAATSCRHPRSSLLHVLRDGVWPVGGAARSAPLHDP